MQVPDATSFTVEPEIVHGLVQGLYMHVGPELQDMMRMYEFVQIEGLLGVSGS